MTDKFKFLNNISAEHENIFDQGGDPEEDLDLFFLLNGLSQHPDTLFYANEVNKMEAVPDRLKYDYLFYSIRKKSRWGSWAKNTQDNYMDAVSEYFGYNREKAAEAMKILTSTQLEEIVEKISHK